MYLYSYVNFESHCLLGSSQLSSQSLVRSVNSFPSYDFTLSCSWASGVTSSILVVLNQHDSAREDTGWWNPSGNPNEEVIQLWAFSHFKDQVKIEIKNSKWLFQMEYDGGIWGEMLLWTVFFPHKKERIIKCINDCVILFGWSNKKKFTTIFLYCSYHDKTSLVKKFCIIFFLFPLSSKRSGRINVCVSGYSVCYR